MMKISFFSLIFFGIIFLILAIVIASITIAVRAQTGGDVDLETLRRGAERADSELLDSPLFKFLAYLQFWRVDWPVYEIIDTLRDDWFFGSPK